MKITIGMLLYLLSLDTAIYTNISRQAEYTIDGFEIWDGEFPKKNMLYLITQENLKKRSGSVVSANGAFIPCITYGLKESIFPGVIEATMDAVERYNKEHFKY